MSNETHAALELYKATAKLLAEYDDVREQIAHQGIRIPESTAQDITEGAMSHFRAVYQIPAEKGAPS